METERAIGKLISAVEGKSVASEDCTAERIASAEKTVREMRSDLGMMQNVVTGVVFSMLMAVDKKDHYTCGHSERVADISLKLCRKLGKSKAEQRVVYFSAMLHDVGKIGIPDTVINKNGKLTDEEYQMIRNHTLYGAEILSAITAIPEVDVGAKYHHERYDGRGYPEGLRGEEIPEVARIIQVADSFDAMASRRAYHDPMPLTVVRDEIAKGAGTQFAPDVAAAMLELIDADLAAGKEFADET